MEQRFRYYLVDRSTWRDAMELDGVLSCSITRDLDSETVESAKLTVGDWPLGAELVLRAYMECRQYDEQSRSMGAWERFCMGTWICQTPTRTDSCAVETEVRAYSTLMACSDDNPPEFMTLEPTDTCEAVCMEALGHGIAPTVSGNGSTKVESDWTLDPGSSYLALARDMAAMAGKAVMVDPYGRPYLKPVRDASAMASAWEFEIDSDSIVLPGMTEGDDWYEVPNTVRVVLSAGSKTLVGEATRADSRGRTVLMREDNPDLPENATQADVDRYAAKLLSEGLSASRTFEFEHAWCPVELGDCVTVGRHDGTAQKAVVRKQEVTLQTGCTVKATATYGWEVR